MVDPDTGVATLIVSARAVHDRERIRTGRH